MTNTKGMTMPQIDDAELFGNAEDQRAYEDFCANQEAVEKFTLDKPALICRWRMSNKKVPMLNRHIRALSERLVQGEPLTHNMLSWAKQHVEWSLAEGDYTAHDGVLMLVIDVNGNAAMNGGGVRAARRYVGQGSYVPAPPRPAPRPTKPAWRPSCSPPSITASLPLWRQRTSACAARRRSLSSWPRPRASRGHARRYSRTAQGRLVPGERRARRGPRQPRPTPPRPTPPRSPSSLKATKSSVPAAPNLKAGWAY